MKRNPPGELLISERAVTEALMKVAHEMNSLVWKECPLFVTVMGGGQIFAGRLLPNLVFELETDFVHFSRYGSEKTGGETKKYHKGSVDPKGRVVVLLDDLLDEGGTLRDLTSDYMERGAKNVMSAVWFDKIHTRGKHHKADFVGAQVEDRFIFGCGMDLDGKWRNLKEIRAIV